MRGWPEGRTDGIATLKALVAEWVEHLICKATARHDDARQHVSPFGRG